MIVPDVNLLVYAYDSSSVHHDAAGKWWIRCMTGTEEIGLATVVVFGFVRICTHPRIFQNPLTVAEAAAKVKSWVARPHVRVIDPTPDHLGEVLTLLEQAGTAGNLTTDAQIAALARQEHAILHSNDTDFLRFPGLRWHNPLSGKEQRT
jgi:toxin-antitoxin system PIN domain toxin